jgi:hypothetical protein
MQLVLRYIICDVTPCSRLKVNRCFGGTYRPIFRVEASRALLPSFFTLVSCLAYFSILNMEATRSSETSVDFQRTTRRYIAEDGTFPNHLCENLRSYLFIEIFLLLNAKIAVMITRNFSLPFGLMTLIDELSEICM